MNLDINKIIQDHGQQISDQLRIATDQVYEKLIWYVQITGLINNVLTILTIGFFILYIFLVKFIYKKYFAEDFTDYFTDYDIIRLFLVSVIVGLFLLLIFFIIIDSLIANIMMVVLPEYYLIDQIMYKIN